MTNTVKIQGSGYLLNGIMHVPKVDGNSEYELIKLWIAQGNKPEAEFTEEELIAQATESKKQEAKQYLNSTDWVNAYKLRHDLGLEIIPEYSSKRLVINKREEYIEFLKGAK